MYVNLYVWNGKCYKSFQESLEDDNIIELVRYIEVGSIGYNLVKNSLSTVFSGLNMDEINIYEEPFSTDINWKGND